MEEYLNDPRYIQASKMVGPDGLVKLQDMLKSGIKFEDAVSSMGFDPSAFGGEGANTGVKSAAAGAVGDVSGALEGSTNKGVQTAGKIAGAGVKGLLAGGPVGAAIGIAGAGISALIGNRQEKKAEEVVAAAELAADNKKSIAALDKNKFADQGKNKKKGDGKKETGGIIPGSGVVDGEAVNLNKGDYVLDMSKVMANETLLQVLINKKLFKKTATGIESTNPNAKVTGGEILIPASMAEDINKNLKATWDMSLDTFVAETKPDVAKGTKDTSGAKILSVAGPVLGAAQIAGGIVQGSRMKDIPEITAHTDVKRAADNLMRVAEQGVDPAIAASFERAVEKNRRASIYATETKTPGFNPGVNVATNISSNAALSDFYAKEDEKKFGKIATATSSLVDAGKLKFQKQLEDRKRFGEIELAGANLISSGIGNVTGSLALLDQLKGEKERSKYA